MARISRKNPPVQITEVLNTALYKTAVYARLSVEDNRVDSDSIESQIYMLEKFVKEKPYLEHSNTFFDNGATGINFDREGFNNMMNEVRKGNINCIVVKDLSRFGRNYIETGNYLDKIFPYLGIRFISVNDNFDSYEVGNNEALVIALKSLLHDIYAKDISRKICTLFDVKKRNGEYMAKFAPYGYDKSPDNKHKLIINEERAKVIRDIYKWYIEGLSVTKIAKKLNNMGILSQYKLLYENGAVKGTNGEDKALWRNSSITGILQNYNYIGCIVERKTEKAHYKGGRLIEIPKSDWNIIKNTHEPIINEETFYAVQNLLETAPKQQRRTDTDVNILRGLVFCGNCGSRMERDGGQISRITGLRYYRFACGRKYLMEGICDSKGIREDKLKDIVFHVLKTQIAVLYEAQEITQKIIQSPSYDSKKANLMKDLLYYENKIKSIKNIRKSLYEDYRSEMLSESEYLYAKNKYENDNNTFSLKIEEIKKEISLMSDELMPNSDVVNKTLSFSSEEDLTEAMCKSLIEKIVVDGKKITVHYTFNSEYDALLNFIENNTELEAIV